MTPLHTTESDIELLSQLLGGTGAKYLPRGSHVEITDHESTLPGQERFGRTWEKRATSVSVWPVGVMTIPEVLRTGLLNRNGGLSLVVFEAMKAAMDGVCERVVKPWESAAIPGKL